MYLACSEVDVVVGVLGGLVMHLTELQPMVVMRRKKSFQR